MYWLIYCTLRFQNIVKSRTISHQHHNHPSDLRLAFFLNLSFTVIEVFGGIYTNSLTILSDALHDLGDSVGIGLSWYFQKFSGKGTSNQFTFGYRRFSLLGAIINALILISGSIIILTKSIPEIFNPSPTNSKGMLILAIAGVIVNGYAALKVKRGKSINQKMVYLHLLEDAVGWVATLVGALIMIFFDLPIVDPLLSVIITIYILVQVFSSLKDTFQIILQGVPEHANLPDLRGKISDIDQVEKVLDFHYWSMDGERHVVTIHVLVAKRLAPKCHVDIKKQIRALFPVQNTNHITIEIVTDEEGHIPIEH